MAKQRKTPTGQQKFGNRNLATELGKKCVGKKINPQTLFLQIVFPPSFCPNYDILADIDRAKMCGQKNQSSAADWFFKIV